MNSKDRQQAVAHYRGKRDQLIGKGYDQTVIDSFYTLVQEQVGSNPKSFDVVIQKTEFVYNGIVDVALVGRRYTGDDELVYSWFRHGITTMSQAEFDARVEHERLTDEW